MIFKHRVGSLLYSLIFVGVSASSARSDDPFREKVLPFVQTYCVKCHNKKLSEGELNLTRYTSAVLLAGDFRQWEHVVTFLKEEKMPPKKAKQPSRSSAPSSWLLLTKVLLEEATEAGRRSGAMLPRRLSNAEYNYTIRDLTGVDMRPTASFPVDPASGEGFNNTSEALMMSPNLFKKYYAAGQQVADHVLLTTTGFEFAPFPVVTFSDQQKLYEQAILRFYEQHKINYETYFTAAWSYRHRPASRRDVTIEAWAAENKLSPKYLRSLWVALQDDAPSNVFYIQWLRQRWNALLPGDPETQTAVPAETRQAIRILAGDIQRLSLMLCVPETQAIISNAGNAPIPHIDRRKKTAASRDKFNPALIEQPTQRLQWEIKNNPDKSAAKLIISVSKVGSEMEDGYVILNQLNFSSSAPSNYNPKETPRRTSRCVTS